MLMQDARRLAIYIDINFEQFTVALILRCGVQCTVYTTNMYEVLLTISNAAHHTACHAQKLFFRIYSCIWDVSSTYCWSPETTGKLSKALLQVTSEFSIILFWSIQVEAASFPITTDIKFVRASNDLTFFFFSCMYE